MSAFQEKEDVLQKQKKYAHIKLWSDALRIKGQKIVTVGKRQTPT